jgi:small subunit ribosomal protein S9
MDDTTTPSTESSATLTTPVLPPEQAAPEPVSPTANPGGSFFTTGRRKEAIARVRLTPGTGKIIVNRKPYDQYFNREAWRVAIRQPLLLTHLLGKHDVHATVDGGGSTGQAGAIRLGIARAVLQLDPAHKATLRTAGLLTRDPRMKERKKYGQKGARKRFQWTKR